MVGAYFIFQHQLLLIRNRPRGLQDSTTDEGIHDERVTRV